MTVWFVIRYDRIVSRLAGKRGELIAKWIITPRRACTGSENFPHWQALALVRSIITRVLDYWPPIKRSTGNYRLYDDETLARIRRIEQLKAQKFTLEEIREQFAALDKIVTDEAVTPKLEELHTHLTQLEREVKELEPVLEQLKPQQAKRLFRAITPQTAACVEALFFF